MWLIVSLIAAIVSTGAYLALSRRFRLGTLSVMLWGLTLMIAIDHILGYEGGPFLETETEGLVPNSLLLGFLMLIPVMAIWAVVLIVERVRAISNTR